MTAILVATIGTLGGVIIAIIETRKGRRATEQARAVSISEHRDSTDQLDELVAEVRAVRRDIGGIREEIRHERRERHHLEQMLATHLQERHR